MADLIDRQAAIDFIDAGHLVNPNEPRWSDNEVVAFLQSRPSAQPERKKGEWWKLPDTGACDWYECSECGDTYLVDFNFCPGCGADMRGEVKND